MVMLAARDIPGQRFYLFAPRPGVPRVVDASLPRRPFQKTALARCSSAAHRHLQEGAYLRQGMLEALPDAATATIPLRPRARARRGEQRAVGRRGRAARPHAARDAHPRALQRPAHHLPRAQRDGPGRAGDGAPGPQRRAPARAATGTPETNGNAPVPTNVPARRNTETVVTTRTPFSTMVNLQDERAGRAHDRAVPPRGQPPADVAQAPRGRSTCAGRSRSCRASTPRRRSAATTSSATPRRRATTSGRSQRNPQAADLRTQLTARLGRRHRARPDHPARGGARRRSASAASGSPETVRGIDVDTSRQAPAPTAAPTP